MISLARLAFAALSFSAVVVGGTAFADTPIERGSYLVNTIMTCGNCHSPKGPPNVVAGKYPFWSYEHMYTNGPPTPDVERFIAYITSNSDLLNKAGYILIRDMKVKETDR